MNPPLEIPHISYRQRWRAFMRLFGDVGFILNAEGRCKDVIDSGSVASLLCEDSGTLLGRRLHDVFPAERANRFLASIDRAIDTGEVQTIGYQIEGQAGTRWFEASLSPLPSDGDTPAHILCLARDITENKHRKWELWISERRFEAIFNDPHVILGILNSDGSLQRANQTALDLIDADPADVEDVPFWETPWWSHSETLQTDLRQWIERAIAGEYVEYEATHYTSTGERMIVGGSLRPITDSDGEVVSVIVSGSDNTERKQQKQRLQVLHRILRHNLRNKVNTIQGQAEWMSKELVEEDGDESLHEIVETITEQAADLTETAEKIQRFKQVSETRPTETVAISDLFTRVVGELQEEHSVATIEITTPNKEISVPKLVELAVAEAVENALEHHDRTTPTVELACEIVTTGDQPQVMVLIIDNGPGIPENERAPLLAGEETALNHASSVGLWLIKWVVDSLGGNLTLTDNKPRGSIVAFTIPLTPDDR